MTTLQTSVLIKAVLQASGEEGDVVVAETGKRYRCPQCGAEFIVTKGGDGTLRCGDTELEKI